MSEKYSTVYMYTSCLSFNFWLEILWLCVSATGSHAGGLLGCLCLLVDGFLRIQAKVGECWILSLARLDCFFFRHSETGHDTGCCRYIFPLRA